MKSFINIKVKNKEKNLRIDILLSNQDNKLSRSRVKSLILENKLRINNIIITDPSKKIKFLTLVLLSSFFLFVKYKSILISFSVSPTINLMVFFIIYNINTICVRSSTG